MATENHSPEDQKLINLAEEIYFFPWHDDDDYYKLLELRDKASTPQARKEINSLAGALWRRLERDY
ncbi:MULTISPECIES: hypothetical protein [Muribaculaceae]|uniref:hypothetical protein n=1 Tax=Muribaculaceae TaxID=2005473 RepID=UPI0026481ED5|nr:MULTISPECIES: hypothetical protein [Muribaculaceae]